METMIEVPWEKVYHWGLLEQAMRFYFNPAFRGQAAEAMLGDAQQQVEQLARLNERDASSIPDPPATIAVPEAQLQAPPRSPEPEAEPAKPAQPPPPPAPEPEVLANDGNIRVTRTRSRAKQPAAPFPTEYQQELERVNGGKR